MKLNKLFIASGVIALALCGCNHKMKENNALSTETFAYTDSCKYANVNVKAEIPLAANSVSAAIRADLISIVKMALARDYEDVVTPEYEGDTNNMQEMLNYYCGEKYKRYVENSREDAVTRESEDYIFTFEYEMNVKKDRETDDYVVFQCFEYAFLGGAHGGVFGEGPVVFSKKDGSRLTTAIDTSNVVAIQPLLKEGLNTYFFEKSGASKEDDLFDYLLLNDSIIPLPVYIPYPDGDSLVFVYQQYEIAAYAAGMPAFKLPISKVKPYLTPQAIKVFGIKD